MKVSHTTHVLLAVPTVAAVPAKTANKPVLRERDAPSEFVGNARVSCRVEWPVIFLNSLRHLPRGRLVSCLTVRRLGL
jgi:hypothetical protein